MLKWNNLGNGVLEYSSEGTFDKYAMFDMDGTLITTKSGSKFPKNENDWKWLFSNIQDKLSSLLIQDYGLIIVSNQRSAKPNSDKIEKIRIKVEKMILEIAQKTFSCGKIENIFSGIYSKIKVFILTGNGFYRKPCPGAWINNIRKTKPKEIFYVGDAAGRIYKPFKYGKSIKKKDFSDSDRGFAYNISLYERTLSKIPCKFYTPEQFFMGAQHENYLSYKWTSFLPHRYVKDLKKQICEMPKKDKPIINIEKLIDKIENAGMIIMVGPPASGKSELSKILKTYLDNDVEIINQDTLKTSKKCQQMTMKYLKEKKIVIIDNTNPSIENRKKYIDLYSRYGDDKKIFIIEMKTPLILCEHYNTIRDRSVSKVVYRVFNKKFEKVEEHLYSDKISKIEFMSYPNPKSLDQKMKFLYITT